MSRLTIEGKVGIAVVAVLTIAFSIFLTNNAQAQASRTGRPDVVIQTTVATSTDFSKSSVYITGASGRDYITPFAGFGVSMLPDSCYAYNNISADIQKITYVLSTQIKEMVDLYSSNSCNTQTTLSPTCTSYLDSINNLTLTYATYQVEGLKQASEKTRLCNTDNTRKTGVSPRTYYGIDVVALTYASVRDAYVNKSYRSHTTLLNNVNSNLTSKMNVAIRSDKFTDKVTSSSTLRTLAYNTFKNPSQTPEPRSRVLPATPSTSLSVPNAFLFFGQTDNVTNRQIAAIPFNSLQEYVNAYNANKTRFADIYNPINRTLIDQGENVLMNINRKIELRLPPREVLPEPVAVATTSTDQVLPATQKASVINSIGNWFGGIWSAIADFFGYMFWGEKAEAAPRAGKDSRLLVGPSGSGASGSGESFDEKMYKQLCPALPNPVPKQKLVAVPSDNKEEEEVFFKNLLVKSPGIKQATEYVTGEHFGTPTLGDAEIEHIINKSYFDHNTSSFSGRITGSETPPKKPEDVRKEIEDRTKEPYTYGSGPMVVDLSKPTNPYNCLRDFDTHETVDWSQYFHPMSSSFYDSLKITVRAVVAGTEQIATETFSTKKTREAEVLNNFERYETLATNLQVEFVNRANKRK